MQQMIDNNGQHPAKPDEQQQQQQDLQRTNFAPPPTTYAAAAAASTTYAARVSLPLRVPAWAQKVVGASVLPLLPVSIVGLPRADPTLMYAVRLCDAFSDVDALMKGERGYVIAAIKAAMHSFVIPSSCKDPCLVLCGWSEAPLVVPKITFLEAPVICEVEPFMREDFIAVQTLHQTPELTNNPAFSERVQLPFKKYSIVASMGEEKCEANLKHLRELSKKKLCCFMNRHAITTNKCFARMISFRISREHTQTEIAMKLLSLTPPSNLSGMYMQHKNIIRILYPVYFTQDIFDFFVKAMSPYCFSISTDDNVFKWSPPQSNQLVLIKRTDGNPIMAFALDSINETLLKHTGNNLTHYKLDGKGGLTGRLANASSVHDNVYGPWAILWRGAEERDKKKDIAVSEAPPDDALQEEM